ncbi:membrane protein [Bacillus andreraoultii]|uniref:membrane protein n=1 Tax=Bacillus andreraoultii TaxID=1499685 RepID=UPI000539FD65|nr:membrane protein [Bacillus andreraoultii]
MLKLMKYEIKGTFKYIIGIMALVLLLITGIYMYVTKGSEPSGFGVLFIVLSILVIFGAGLSTFLYIVGSFKKELYEDRGYLTFTLPLTGNQIIGAKLIVATMWFILLGTVIGLYNVLMVYVTNRGNIDLSTIFLYLSETIRVQEYIVGAIGGIFSIVILLMIIYFSMALSRVTFRNKRIGGLWFVIFLILSGILLYGQVVVADLFPYYINWRSFEVGTMETFFNMNPTIDITSGFNVQVDPMIMMTNIATTIYNIVTFVALYLGTSYIIEKKIDV